MREEGCEFVKDYSGSCGERVIHTVDGKNPANQLIW